MRGEVLHYDEGQGFGFITGQDGNRYTFAREDLRRAAPMSKGTVVEFQPSGGQARDVFSIRAQAGSAVPSIAATDTPQFGRQVSQQPQPAAAPAVQQGSASTGLFSYFWRGLTENYANFRGRARRKEYWGYYLFWLIAFTIVILFGMVIDAALGNMDNTNDVPLASIAAGGLFVLATFLPGLAMTIRRQHDIGLSGWFFLLILIPYIGNMIIFVFSLIPSQKHENKWGPIPAGVS